MNINDKYLQFSSSLSFFEFNQEEFNEPNFIVDDYLLEINEIQNIQSINIKSVENLLKKFPKTFDIFEQLFQLFRFTNTQLIHFLFDIDIMNYSDSSINYVEKTLKVDKNLEKIFNKKISVIDSGDLSELQRIKIFKESLILFIKRFTSGKNKFKNRHYLYDRIMSDIDTRTRISSYLVNNLRLSDFLISINIENFLKNKRIPFDTKNIHGNYGHIRINSILQENNISNVDNELSEVSISELQPNQLNSHQFLKGWTFCTEKKIEGIKVTKTHKPKRFDFIIMNDSKIKYVIETNFYSSQGTKIGINEKEYIDLNNDIKESHPDIKFLWVTDGNYWLTQTGETMYKRDYLEYFQDSLLNYYQLNKLFKEL